MKTQVKMIEAGLKQYEITGVLKMDDEVKPVFYIEAFDIEYMRNMRNIYLPKIAELQQDETIGENSQISPENTTERMAWMANLGIIDFLAEKCTKSGETTNYTRLAKMIEGFTGLKWESIKPNVEAVIKKSIESKNHPLKSKANKKKVIDLRERYGLPPDPALS